MARDDVDNLNELLSAYIDDELDAETSARVENHLAADPTARALYDELRSTRDLLVGLPRGHAPDDMIDNITAQLERRALLDITDDAGDALAPSRLRFGRLLATAAMLAIICTAGFVIFQGIQNPDHPLTLALRENAADEPQASASGSIESPRRPVAQRESANEAADRIGKRDGMTEDEQLALLPSDTRKNKGKEKREVDADAVRSAPLDTLARAEDKGLGTAASDELRVKRRLDSPRLRRARKSSELPVRKLTDSLSAGAAGRGYAYRAPEDLPKKLFLKQGKRSADVRAVTLEVEAPTASVRLAIGDRFGAYSERIPAEVSRENLSRFARQAAPSANRTVDAYTVRIKPSRLRLVLADLMPARNAGLRVRSFRDGSFATTEWSEIDHRITTLAGGTKTARLSGREPRGMRVDVPTSEVSETTLDLTYDLPLRVRPEIRDTGSIEEGREGILVPAPGVVGRTLNESPEDAAPTGMAVGAEVDFGNVDAMLFETLVDPARATHGKGGRGVPALTEAFALAKNKDTSSRGDADDHDSKAVSQPTAARASSPFSAGARAHRRSLGFEVSPSEKEADRYDAFAQLPSEGEPARPPSVNQRLHEHGQDAGEELITLVLKVYGPAQPVAAKPTSLPTAPAAKQPADDGPVKTTP